MCTFEIQAIVTKATLPTKPEFLSSQRIFHPLLILQVVSTSLKLRLLLASLHCRRCLLTQCNGIQYVEKCSGTPLWKHNMEKMQIDPKYSFHQIDPKYSFQQIESTGKSSDVLNTSGTFLKKVPWGIVHYYWCNEFQFGWILHS